VTIQKLASAIAKREGKKSQARIGEVREILKIICTMELEAFDSDGEIEFVLPVFHEYVQTKISKRKKRARK
jgi:hypothetical protein